jgi:probable phosphoglycerate mutase
MDDSFPRTPDARTVLYLIRHGETEHNRRGIIQGGGVDSPLNERGRAQADALAERFRTKTVDALYASTLQRARQTADILAQPHQPLSRTHLRDLNEMDWGIFEGEPPSEERDASMGAIKADWRAGHYGRAIDGGESIQDVQHRARRALQHVFSREAGRTAAVVTHGRYLRVLLATLLSDFSLADMNALGHANTCVNRVVCEQGRAWADPQNCTAHLASVEAPAST